jgi:hypothetical protein
VSDFVRQQIATQTIKQQELESSIRDLETSIIGLNASLAHERTRRAKLLQTVNELASRHAALIATPPTPFSFVEFLRDAPQWLRFRASFRREDAVRVLDGQPIGSFLTRPSGESSLVLSFVSSDDSVKHAVLQYSDERGVFFAERRPDKVFRSLRALIESFGFEIER